MIRADDVLVVDFEGDMAAFIEAGEPAPSWRGRRPRRWRPSGCSPCWPAHAPRLPDLRGPRQGGDGGARPRAGPARLLYEVPAYYKGCRTPWSALDAEIPWPAYAEQLNYELELACVISRGRDIAAADARDHVFGWTLWERPVGARHAGAGAAARHGPQQGQGLGRRQRSRPCFVTADEVDGDVELVLRVNGEERTRARSSQMHHDWGALIAYASQGCTLYPGEVLGSGTVPGGAGVESGRFLAPGDVVELEGEGIGVLANRIGPRP